MSCVGHVGSERPDCPYGCYLVDRDRTRAGETATRSQHCHKHEIRIDAARKSGVTALGDNVNLGRGGRAAISRGDGKVTITIRFYRVTE